MGRCLKQKEKEEQGRSKGRPFSCFFFSPFRFEASRCLSFREEKKC